MVGIYKITSPSGKIYIGQSIDIKKRWFNHHHPSKDTIGRKLYNSLKKYGPENHKFEIVEECLNEELNDKEVYWKKEIINEIGWENVLFHELFDGGGGPRSQEIKDKISISSRGKNNKSILQYDLNGNFIKEWNTIKEAEETYKTGISDVVRKKGKTCGGFIWRYKEDPLPIGYKISKHKLCKKVYQYNLEDKLIKIWNSTIEIQQSLGYPNSNISVCCLGKQKTAYGFKWKYEKK